MELEYMKQAETSTSETVISSGKACYLPPSRHSPSHLSPSSIEEQQFVLQPELCGGQKHQQQISGEQQQILCPEEEYSHQQQHHMLHQHDPIKKQQQFNLKHHQVGQEHHQLDQGQQQLCQRLQQLKQLKQDQQQFSPEQLQRSPEQLQRSPVQQQLSLEQQHLSPEQQQLSPEQNHQQQELQHKGQLNQHQYQLQQVQEQHQLSHEEQHYHRQQYQLQQIQEHQHLSQEQQQHRLEQKHQQQHLELQQHDQVNKQQHHLEQVEGEQVQKVRNQQQSNHDALEMFPNKLSTTTAEDYLASNIANIGSTADSITGHQVSYYLDPSVSGVTSGHHVPVPLYLDTTTAGFTGAHNDPLYLGASTLGSIDGHHISHNSSTSTSCSTGEQHAPHYLGTSITASIHSSHDPLGFKSDEMPPAADAVDATQVHAAYSDVMEHNYRHIRNVSIEQNEKIIPNNLGVQNCLDQTILQNEKVDSINSEQLAEHQAVQVESEPSHESRGKGEHFMSVTQTGLFSSPSNSFTSSQISITSPIITTFQLTENVAMSDKQTEVPDSNTSFAKTQIEHDAKNSQAVDKEKLKENTGSENVANYVCLCTQDLLNHTRYKSKTYICGHCLKKFITICQLHQHLEKHGSGGSYHFDHISQTAYPKYDTFCSFTQTDEDLFIIRLDESVTSEGTGNIGSFGYVENDITSISHKETDEIIKATVEPSHVIEQVYESPRKNRKRKQDNPKHTKPRISDLRKNDKVKKIRRKHDTKKKKNNEYYEDTYDCQAKSDDIGLMVLENGENNNVIQHLNKEIPDCSVVEIKEELTYQVNDSAGVNKPHKKRGRPRKSAGNNKKNFAKKRKIVKTDDNADGRLKSGLSDDIEYRNKSDEHTSLTDTDNDDGESYAEMEIEVDNAIENDEDQKHFSEPHTKRKKRKNATKYQVCDVCGLPVPRYNYVYHMRQHTGEKPFVCDKCGKAFAHRRFLAKHLMTHAEDKPFKCNLCSAQFCQKSEFSMHMNAHEGNRPYECRVCGIKFLSKSMLNTHQANIHMGITRFECEVCNRRFFKRSSLNVHQATHFEATMKCNFCDRMFKDRAGLKRHERIHTGEKRFRCHVCSHDFIQSTPYWVHMEKRHQMNRESVKHMLKDIRDSNKRYGIRTEINVLPTDVDHLLVSQEKTDNAVLKTKKENAKDAPEKSVGMLKYTSNSMTASDHSLPVPDLEQQFVGEGLIQKLYTDIKVPNIYTSNVSDLVTSSIYSQAVQSEIMSMNQIFRNIIPDTDAIHIPTTASESNTIATPETPATSTQSIDLSNSLPMPVSLGVSLSVPHQHGFIGLNPLHRALDYSSSMPHTSTYTDISSDRLNSEHQQ